MQQVGTASSKSCHYDAVEGCQRPLRQGAANHVNAHPSQVVIEKKHRSTDRERRRTSRTAMALEVLVAIERQHLMAFDGDFKAITRYRDLVAST